MRALSGILSYIVDGLGGGCDKVVMVKAVVLEVVAVVVDTMVVVVVVAVVVTVAGCKASKYSYLHIRQSLWI